MQNTPSNVNNNNINNNNDGSFYPLPVATVVPLSCPSASVTVATATTKKPKKQKNNKSLIGNTATEALKDQGYTTGLIRSIARNSNDFPVRFWVVDNSGSMSSADGHRLYAEFSNNNNNNNNNTVKLLDCTRWAEIKDTVTYHARMAALLEAPTTFGLLNPASGCPQQFDVGMAMNNGTDNNNIEEDLSNLTNSIETISPMGATPLSDHVRDIRFRIESMRDELVANGQKAVVVLATDGVPTNRFGEDSQHTRNDFKRALQSLEGLPLWLVIRLCTDDDEVVNFYNEIDSQLEFSLDVLDDFFAEAREVYEHNKWLNYALPLHRMREMGFFHKLFDLLDERPFTRDEIKEFVLLLFGSDSLDGLRDPQIDWQRFLDTVAGANSKERLQWNPVKKKMTSWIDVRKLDYYYGNATSCTC
jgi:hypothetical protein